MPLALRGRALDSYNSFFLEVWRAFSEAWSIEAGVFIVTLGILIATSLQVRVTRRSAERQLRAYITLSDALVKVTQLENALWQVHFTLVFRNHGQTPAYNLSTPAEYALVPSGQKPFDNWVPNDTDFSGSIIGPSVQVTVNQNFIIGEGEELQSLIKAQKQLYIWGRVRYTDAFGAQRFFKYVSRNSGNYQFTKHPNGLTEYLFALEPHEIGYTGN